MTRKWRNQLSINEVYLKQAQRMQSALSAGRFAEAFRICAEILHESPNSIPALIGISMIGQLSDCGEIPGLELSHVQRALDTASVLESMGGSADHEYGRFLYAVEADSDAALDVIERGIARREAELLELTIARIEALVDTDRLTEARSEFSRAQSRFPDVKELKTLKQDLAYLLELEPSACG